MVRSPCVLWALAQAGACRAVRGTLHGLYCSLAGCSMWLHAAAFRPRACRWNVQRSMAHMLHGRAPPNGAGCTGAMLTMHLQGSWYTDLLENRIASCPIYCVFRVEICADGAVTKATPTWHCNPSTISMCNSFMGTQMQLANQAATSLLPLIMYGRIVSGVPSPPSFMNLDGSILATFGTQQFHRVETPKF